MGQFIAFLFVIFCIYAIAANAIEKISEAGLWEEISAGVLVITGIITWLIIESKRGAREQAERQARDRHQKEQSEIRKSVNELVAESAGVVEVIPSKIKLAEQALDQAEFEFREGAFIPFWDAVESAVNYLGHFDQGVTHVVKNLKRHNDLIAKLDNEKPTFSVVATNLPDPRSTSDRMQKIVRQAHKNYEFASMYEKRKTNQILVAGFGNLANAINNMSYWIENSINNLSGAISVSFENQNEILSEHLGGIREVLESENKEGRKHEEREREMLDNIQRRRKPFP